MTNSPWLTGFLLLGAALYGLPTLLALPPLIRLLAALARRAARWPGPLVSYRDPRDARRPRPPYLIRPARPLFAEFCWSWSTLAAASAYFLMSWVETGTTWLAGHVQISWTWGMVPVMLTAMVAGQMSAARLRQYAPQLTACLDDISGGGEPREADGDSARSRYAIAHPLLGRSPGDAQQGRALLLFVEATKANQDGQQMRGLALYQEALSRDPQLHQRASAALADMAERCAPAELGPAAYWLGLHAEYMLDLRQAAAWYQRAVDAFAQIGYARRASRACCNLGNVRWRTRDPAAMETMERAAALDPENGIAHINIAAVYYGVGEPGDDRHSRAIDAFAEAVLADPSSYGPIVIAKMREISYVWEADLDLVTERVERRRRERQQAQTAA